MFIVRAEFTHEYIYFVINKYFMIWRSMESRLIKTSEWLYFDWLESWTRSLENDDSEIYVKFY